MYFKILNVNCLEITQNDYVIELGAGRGRVALFLSEYVGCKVKAVEKIPEFASKMVASQNLKMVTEDMVESKFESSLTRTHP